MEKKKILLVEDEKILLDLYAAVLLRQGRRFAYEVAQAESAEEALQDARQHVFDLVITDYHLPGEDGISLIKKVKTLHPATAFILISGYLSPEVQQSALDAGADTCLKKPCSIGSILETVEKALVRERAAGRDPAAPAAEAPEAEIIPPPADGQKPAAFDFFILVLDKEGRIVFSDGHFPRLLGLKKAAVLSRPLADFLYSYFLQYLAKQEINLMQFVAAQGERPVTLDFVSGRDSHRHPFVCEFILRDAGFPGAWETMIVGMDMEKKLELYRLIEFERESLHRLRYGQFDMVITINKDCRIKTINNTCLAKLKAKQRDLVDAAFTELLSRPRDRESFAQGIAQAQTLQDVFNLRLDLLYRGQTIPVLVNISAVRDSFNDEIGYVLVLRDIERQLKMEATLRSVERMQALGQLAAGTAHQINNYTNAIMGSTELLHDCVNESFQDNPRAGADALGVLKIIQESVQKLTALTRHLTAFARAQQAPVISAGDVNQVVRDTLALVHTHVKKKAITLKIELEEKLPLVYFSPLHLEQAVLNIVMNAVDAVEHLAGRITVSTFRRPEWVCIAVADNGPGIPPEIRGQIFEAFVTTKPAGVGTGLGLNVARDVVESIKGAIDVESSAEKGTTMTIKIPILAKGRAVEQ